MPLSAGGCSNTGEWLTYRRLTWHVVIDPWANRGSGTTFLAPRLRFDSDLQGAVRMLPVRCRGRCGKRDLA